MTENLTKRNLQNTRYETWDQRPVVRFHYRALTAEGELAHAYMEAVVVFDDEFKLDPKLAIIHNTQPRVLRNVIEHLKNERDQKHSQGIDIAITQLSEIVAPKEPEAL